MMQLLNASFTTTKDFIHLEYDDAWFMKMDYQNNQYIYATNIKCFRNIAENSCQLECVILIVCDNTITVVLIKYVIHFEENKKKTKTCLKSPKAYLLLYCKKSLYGCFIFIRYDIFIWYDIFKLNYISKSANAIFYITVQETKMSNLLSYIFFLHTSLFYV